MPFLSLFITFMHFNSIILIRINFMHNLFHYFLIILLTKSCLFSLYRQTSSSAGAPHSVTSIPTAMDKVSYSSACAAAGQVSYVVVIYFCTFLCIYWLNNHRCFIVIISLSSPSHNRYTPTLTPHSLNNLYTAWSYEFVWDNVQSIWYHNITTPCHRLRFHISRKAKERTVRYLTITCPRYCATTQRKWRCVSKSRVSNIW